MWVAMVIVAHCNEQNKMSLLTLFSRGSGISNLCASPLPPTTHDTPAPCSPTCGFNYLGPNDINCKGVRVRTKVVTKGED